MLQVPILGSGSLILQKWGAVIDRWQIRSGQNLKIGGRQIPQWVPKPKESVPPGGRRSGSSNLQHLGAVSSFGGEKGGR